MAHQIDGSAGDEVEPVYRITETEHHLAGSEREIPSGRPCEEAIYFNEHDRYHVLKTPSMARRDISTSTLRLLALIALLFPAPALAQSSHGYPDRPANMPMNHGAMHATPRGTISAVATQPGQAAFAAIQEIVQILEADPRTDWSKVNIDALRQHLIDMNNVTLAAEVRSESVEGGLRFFVTGAGSVTDSIRRMLSAHAATMDGIDGWQFSVSDINGGAMFTVRVPPQDSEKLRGLGFIGVMSHGMHHQEHHWMIARGEHPHG